MSHTNFFRIESYDVGPSKRARISAIMKYMQKTAGDDLTKNGLSYETLRSIGLAFVLSKAKLEILKPIKTYDDIRITTWQKTIKRRLTFVRDFFIQKGEETVAKATTEWVLIDFEKRSIVRPSSLPHQVPDEDMDTQLETAARFDAYEPLCDIGSIRVRSSMLDENMHVNNTVYADFAEDFSFCEDEKKSPKMIEIHFNHEAILGETIKFGKYETKDAFYLRGDSVTNDRCCFEALVGY